MTFDQISISYYIYMMVTQAILVGGSLWYWRRRLRRDRDAKATT
jgi:hypothetical protein